MNTTAKVTIGVLAGASLGLLAGVLIAPSSGRKTRAKLLGKSKELKNQMVATLDDAKKAYNKKVEAYVNEGKHGIETLKNSLKV